MKLLKSNIQYMQFCFYNIKGDYKLAKRYAIHTLVKYPNYFEVGALISIVKVIQ